MCGITGWVSYDRDLHASARHIGCDDADDGVARPGRRGTWIDPPAALGHRRLAIIDLQGGVSP